LINILNLSAKFVDGKNYKFSQNLNNQGTLSNQLFSINNVLINGLHLNEYYFHNLDISQEY